MGEGGWGYLQDTLRGLSFVAGGVKAFQMARSSLAGALKGAMASSTGRNLTSGTISRMTRAVENRMRALGISDDAIGIFDGDGFNPSGNTVGGNVRGVGIEVDSAVFNDIPGFKAWNEASLSTRVDAVIAHEFAEYLGATHSQAVKTAAETALNISDKARNLLKAMAELF